jgi:hypothetical protein
MRNVAMVGAGVAAVIVAMVVVFGLASFLVAMAAAPFIAMRLRSVVRR